MRHRRRRLAGMNLVGVLVAAALMALVAVGFMRFMGNATRAQSNLSKVGEAAGLDMGIRAMLQNQKACVETTKVLALNQVTSATNPVLQPVSIRDPNGKVLFQKGQNSNGVSIDDMQAEVFAATGGVQAIRIYTKFKKLGDVVGGKPAYEHNYYVNVVLDAAGAVSRCFEKEAQGELQLMAIDTVTVENHSPPYRVVAYLCNGATPWNDLNWGFEIPCSVSAGATTPPYVGPATTIHTQGNYLVFQLNTGLGIFARPTDPTATAVSIAVAADLLINGPGLNNFTLGIGQDARGSDESGFLGTTHLTVGSPVPVTVDKDYQVQLRLFAVNGGNTTQMPKITATMSSAHGTVLHYLKSGN